MNNSELKNTYGVEKISMQTSLLKSGLIVDYKFIEISLMVSKTKGPYGWSYDADIIKPTEAERSFYGHLCGSRLGSIDMIFQQIEKKIEPIGKLQNVNFDFSIKPISTEAFTDKGIKILERHLEKKFDFRKDKKRTL